MTETGRERLERLSKLVVVLLLVRLVQRLLTAPINEDELEVLQVAWLLDHDVVFHRDYVYPHLPTLALLLLPLYRWLGPGIELAEAARLAGLPVLLLGLWVLAKLARRISGQVMAGWFAVGFVLASPAMVTTMIETRGDVFAVAFVLVGLACAFRGGAGGGPTRTDAGLAAAAFGLSSLFNQKGIFVALVTLAALDRCYWTAGLARGERWLRALGFLVVGALPFTGAVATLMMLGITDAAALQLVLTTGQWVLNQDLFAAYKPYILFRSVALLAPSWCLAMLGLRATWRRARAGGEPDGGSLATLVASALVVNLLYLAVQPVCTLQLMWTPLCLAAVLAAGWLAERPATVGLGVLVLTVALAALDPHRDEDDLPSQRARMDWVLVNVPEDQAVLDGRRGLEAFRPLIEAPPERRLQQYRPWAYAPGFRAVHEAAVLRAIARGEVGAVILHPNVRFFPEEIWFFILERYGPSEHPDVLVPRAPPMGDGGPQP